MAALLQREVDAHQDGLDVGTWNASLAVAVLADDDGRANRPLGQVGFEGDSGLIQEREQFEAADFGEPGGVSSRTSSAKLSGG